MVLSAHRGAAAPNRAPFVAALLLLAISVTATAQPQAPPPPTRFFTDTTGLVPVEAATRIEARLQDLQKTSSNQVLVVVADHLPEGYASLEEYTNRTAEAWRVGNKERDNGVVLFVFVGDRKLRIEVGYGLEAALPDALASRIISDEITPRFRRGEFGPGLEAGVDAIIRATKGEYKPLPARTESRSNPSVVLIVVLLFFLFGVVFPIMREVHDIRHSRTYSSRGLSSGRRRGGWGGENTWGGWSGGNSWGGGGGGGGFSGGGGSFGGGGASGSW